MKSDNKAAFALLKALSLLIIVPLGRGWALSLLWWWFIALPFHVRGIHWAHAAALSMLVSLAVDPKKDEAGNYSTALMNAVLTPAFVVGLGYIFVLLAGIR